VCNLWKAEVINSIKQCGVLYECETWSFTPWDEETKQCESENKMMKKIPGPKKAYTTREFRTV
jgi:hypothetical protein